MMAKLKINFNLKNFEQNLEKTSNKILKIFENINDNETEKSVFFFNSQYSLSNWKDEIEEKGCLGVLLNVYVPNFCRSGKSLNMIKIYNITSCFMSVSDFINIVCSESNTTYTCDINVSTVLNDDVLGYGNIVLPIYINKYHWEMSKEYIPVILGLLISNNVSLYCPIMDNIYYSVLFEYTKNIFSNKNVKWSHNWIITWIGIFRTCFQLSSEKRYHKGFVKYIENLNDVQLNGEYSILFGQMLSIGYTNIDTINKIFSRYVLHLITSYINENIEYKKLFIAILTNNDKQIQKELVLIYNSLNFSKIINDYVTIMFGIKLILFIKNLDRGLLNFIKKIDDHYGAISDEYIEKIFDFCCELKNSINLDNDVIYFSELIPFNISTIATYLENHVAELFY